MDTIKIDGMDCDKDVMRTAVFYEYTRHNPETRPFNLPRAAQNFYGNNIIMYWAPRISGKGRWTSKDRHRHRRRVWGKNNFLYLSSSGIELVFCCKSLFRAGLPAFAVGRLAWVMESFAAKSFRLFAHQLDEAAAMLLWCKMTSIIGFD